MDSTNFTDLACANYKERITYDANGNIKTYLRNGTTAGGSPQSMDNLTYGYNITSGKLTNNRLRHVDDAVSSGNYSTDIDDQNTDNYGYDEIGNLTKDLAEGINTNGITWSVYGKILSIVKSGNTISYTYDASGNRISKAANNKTTWYVRDASGNVMAIYEKRSDLNSNHVTQSEVHLYGSSRLGIFNLNRDMESPSSGDIVIFERGQKFFELSNHLGNVLVTISDKKLGIDANTDGTVEYYLADVASANDYYPGGMDMPGRQYNATTGYRYGFNGKENDKDINGGGQDYGMRIYDRRLVRFLSVDPITSKYPELTPYQFASNTPIQAIDFDGLEAVVWRTGWFARTVSKPKLKQGEWYEIHNYFISYIPSISLHKESFKEAIVYNAQNNRSGAYSSISQRHDFYKYGQELLSDKGVDSKWFEAASVVTSWNAIGGADLDGFGLILGKDSRDFLTKGNEFLFSKNIQTFNQLYSTGRLNIDYRTSNGKPNSNTRVIIHDSGGEDMDYAMVMYEQLLVQDFISSYKKEHPNKDMNKIFKQINEAFSSSLGNKQVKEVLKSTFTDKGREFDFSSYDNRVELGKALVDKLREKKE